MTILLFDTPASRANMYPLTLTRPVCDIRYGILTIREHWRMRTGLAVYPVSEEYLQEQIPASDYFICVDTSVLPDAGCFELILALKPGEMLEDQFGMVAYSIIQPPMYNQVPVWLNKSQQVQDQQRLGHISSVFLSNADRIRSEFELVTKHISPGNIDPDNSISHAAAVFVAEGVQMKACIINASEGPVYIGENALIMEGTTIRGPVAICNNAVVKMGTRLYGGTTIGPYCTAGGEIKNSILSGFSNKAHDGYLGDSILGEWCNMGAGTSNSNVKNTAGTVKMWSEAANQFIPVGLKAGLVMGDYSRTAINSSINTGTSIGVSCNVYEGNYPLKHLPSFSWGNYGAYEFDKACRDAANWKKMKGMEFTDRDRLILQHVFNKKPAQENQS